MGVITTAYSIPPDMMRKIRANNDKLEFILDTGEEVAARWAVEEYDFDKAIDEKSRILNGCGFVKTAKRFDCESYFYAKGRNYLDYDSYNVWIIPPSEVKAMFKELEHANFEELKATGLANEVTDYDGDPILEDDYQYYIGDIEEIKKFLNAAAAAGNYLLFAAA